MTRARVVALRRPASRVVYLALHLAVGVDVGVSEGRKRRACVRVPASIYKQFSAVSAVYGFTVRLHSVQLLHATF